MVAPGSWGKMDWLVEAPEWSAPVVKELKPITGPHDKECCLTRECYLQEHNGEGDLQVGHLRPSQF